jgi:uncharacterized protein
MKLSGSYTFAAPREMVWELLNDPATLRRIIPGCERLEQIGDDLYAADIKLGLAGVRGDYSGTVRISNQQPPERYRLEGDGKGKPGFAKGSGDVELETGDGGTTTMRYKAEAQVGGPVAGVGQRLIEGAAKSIINQSLKALNAELEARQSVTSESNGAITPEPDAPPEAAAQATDQPEDAARTLPALPTTSTTTAPARWEADSSPTRGLTTMDLLRGIADDLVSEQPALRWTLPLIGGFVLGLLVGIGLARGPRSD